MSRATLALAAGLTAIAVALGIVLSGSPVRIAGTNGIPARPVELTHGDEQICQEAGTVPAGTSAIRVSLSPNVGPRVQLKVLAGSTVVSQGEYPAGWGTDETVTVPISPVTRVIPVARICTTVGADGEAIQVNGSIARTASGATAVALRLEYLRAASGSWLSRLPALASDMGAARAPIGAWVAYLVIAVTIALCAFVSRVFLAESRHT